MRNKDKLGKTKKTNKNILTKVGKLRKLGKTMINQSDKRWGF